jgi:hypothetical protein
MPPPHLLLYSRQGCCLCEGLEQRLRALPGVTGLEVIDVDRDPGLQQRYGLEVPVLLIGFSLELDRTGAVFLGFGSLLWLLAGIYAAGYPTDAAAQQVDAGCAQGMPRPGAFMLPSAAAPTSTTTPGSRLMTERRP